MLAWTGIIVKMTLYARSDRPDSHSRGRKKALFGILDDVRLIIGLTALISLAGAASAGNIVIRPGAAIGKLSLGMGEADARRAYKFPYIEREARSFGRERVSISFGLSGYSIVLYGPRGRAHVVQIATSSATERTREGIGVGSTEARLKAAYGRRLTCDRLQVYVEGGMRFYTPVRNCYLRARGVETIFRNEVGGDRRDAVHRWDSKKARVFEVIVQVKPLPA